MSTILLVIFVCLIASIGAAIGSFLNVVIWRVPEKMSLSSPPSHCPKCNAPVRWFDNVPILSWFILGGKCRDCKEPISGRYPLVEFLSFLFSLIIAMALLFGNWTAWKSQPFYWENYSNWMEVYGQLDNTTENGMDTIANRYIDDTSFNDRFMQLLRSTTIFALLWTIVVDTSLMLGFVEWDRGRVPRSLVIASASILCISFIAILFLNEPQLLFERCKVFVTSVFLGELGIFLSLKTVEKANREEFFVLGAVWGVCAGYILAFPGALLLALVAFILKRKFHKQTFGICVFAVLFLLLFVETFGVIV